MSLRVVQRALLILLSISFIIPLSVSIGPGQFYISDPILSALLLSILFRREPLRLNQVSFWPLVTLSAFSGWIVITSLLSLNPIISIFEGLVWVRVSFIFFLITVFYNDLYTKKDIFWTAFILLSIQIILALIQGGFQTEIGQVNQYFGTKKSVASAVRIGDQELLRAQGTFSNPNKLAAWIVLLLPLALLRNYDITSEIFSRANYFLILAAVVSLLFSMSRGVLLLFVAVTILFIGMLSLTRAVLFVGVSVPLLIMFSTFTPYLERFVSTIQSGSTRLWSLVESIFVISEYPLTGTGYSLYSVGKSNIDLITLPVWVPDRAHTIYTLIAAETGIVGGMFFLIFLLICFKTYFSAAIKSSVYSTSFLFMFINLLGMMVIYLLIIYHDFVLFTICLIACGIAISGEELQNEDLHSRA